jgi:hypothetical protein
VIDAAALARAERVALVLGHNRGKRDTIDLRYAEQDAKRVAQVLAELGRFSQVRLQTGGSAKTLLALLRELGRKLAERRRRGEPVLFLFYYSGHADETGLQLGETHLPRDALLAALGDLRADTTVVVVDTCHTAGLNRRKGLTAVPPRRVDLVDRLATRGRVIIASSAPGEEAQESERLRGSFFTSHWVTALRGGADSNRDGVVELREAYDYAYHHTIGSTVASVAGVQHPTHRTELHGERDIVLSWPGGSSTSLRLHARDAGSFLVLSDDLTRVFAEISLAQGETARIGLPAGRYAIRKRSPEGLLTGGVTLGKGETGEVDERQLERQAYAVLTTKLGRPEGWLAVTSGIAAGPVGAGVYPTVELGYVLDFGPIALWPALAGSFGRDSEGDIDVETFGFEPQLAALLPLHLKRVVALVGGRVTLPVYWQKLTGTATRTALAVGMDGVLAVATWLARYVGLVLQTHVGTRGAKMATELGPGAQDDSFAWRLAIGASVGLRIRL